MLEWDGKMLCTFKCHVAFIHLMAKNTQGFLMKYDIGIYTKICRYSS
jgi:hypothetical protein